jgi:hypothetical protein
VGVVCFALACLGVLGGLRLAMERAGIEAPPTAFMPLELVAGRLAGLAESRLRYSYPVAFLGDSMVVGHDGVPPVATFVDRQVQRSINASRSIKVHSLALGGMTPFDWYFLADEIVAAAPSQVVVPVSLWNFSRPSIELSKPELSGWIQPARLPEAFGLELRPIGLTVDRLLLYQGIVQAGAAASWRTLKREQVRVVHARQGVEEALGRRFAGEAIEDLERARRMRDGARRLLPGATRLSRGGADIYGTDDLLRVQADDPVVRVLGATLGAFRRAGIPVLVYVGPFNVEHLVPLGAIDEDGLRETLATIARCARDEGAEFVDLHALLPDRAFRDAVGHLGVVEQLHAPKRLAKALAPYIVARARPGTAR